MKRFVAFLFAFAIIAILIPSASAVELLVTDDASPNARPGDGSGGQGGRGSNPFGFLGAETVSVDFVESERVLMKWDLTGVAGIAGDATLRLIMHNDRGGGTAELYKIKASNAAWTEGTLSPGTIDGSNGWNGGMMLSAETGDLRTSGLSDGDLQANADDGFEGVNNGDTAAVASSVWTGGQKQDGSGACAAGDCAGETWNITIPGAVIQNWINNPADNGGLIMMDHDETNHTGSFYMVTLSKDNNNGDTTLGPTLIFDVPEPGSVFLLSLGALCLVATRRRQR